MNAYKFHKKVLAIMALSLLILCGTSVGVRADEEDAKNLLKAMSDYMAAQKAISFAYDATLEVVTKEEQKLALASSGSVTLNHPDKIHVTRSGECCRCCPANGEAMRGGRIQLQAFRTPVHV